MSAELVVALRAQAAEFAQDMAGAATDVQDFASRGGGALRTLQDNWGKVTAASAAVAGGVEALARQQAPLTEATERLAAATGYQATEIRSLAAEMTNATFPLSDVLGLMERGAQQGLENAEDLRRFAEFWDLVGDATNENSGALADAGIALRSVGIDASNLTDATAALGFIHRDTTLQVGEFLGMVGRVAPLIQDTELTVDDLAAVLGGLETHAGVSGPAAQRVLQSALRESGGDLTALLEEVGLTAEQFAEMRGRVDGASDVLQTNADIVAHNKTFMEGLQASLQATIYQYGGVIRSVSDFAPALLAIGPAARAAAVAKNVAAVAARGLGVAMTFALGPVGLVITAITAAVAIGWYLYNNWDEVKALLERLWEGIKVVAQAVWDFIVAGVRAFVDAHVRLIEGMAMGVMLIWERLRDGAIAVWQALLEGIRRAVFGPLDAIREKISGFTDSVSGAFAWLKDTLVGNSIVPDMMGDLGTQFNRLQDLMVSPSELAAKGVEGVFGLLKDKVRGVIDGMLEQVTGKLMDWAKHTLGGFGQSVMGTLQGVLSFIPGGGVIGAAIGGLGKLFGFSGGIAWGPTLGIVGEREPEAVIPLSRLQSAMGAVQDMAAWIATKRPEPLGTVPMLSMAEGGAGVTRGMTAFLAHPNEAYAFAGAGRRFFDAGGRTSVQVTVAAGAITVHGAEGQSEEALAEAVVRRFGDAIDRLVGGQG